MNLKYAFMTPDQLVLIMDLCMGGDLRYWLKKEGTFDEPRAKSRPASSVALGARRPRDTRRYYAARTLDDNA